MANKKYVVILPRTVKAGEPIHVEIDAETCKGLERSWALAKATCGTVWTEEEWAEVQKVTAANPNDAGSAP